MVDKESPCVNTVHGWPNRTVESIRGHFQYRARGSEANHSRETSPGAVAISNLSWNQPAPNLEMFLPQTRREKIVYK